MKIDGIVCCKKGIEAFSKLFEYIVASELLQVKSNMLQEFTLTLAGSVNSTQLLKFEKGFGAI